MSTRRIFFLVLSGIIAVIILIYPVSLYFYEEEERYKFLTPDILPPRYNLSLSILWWLQGSDTIEGTMPQFRDWQHDPCLPPEVQCTFTGNKSDLPSVDVALFEARFPGPIVEKIPKDLFDILPRNQSQYWIIHTMESPLNEWLMTNAYFMKYFNLTSTYRRNSDIPDTYYHRMSNGNYLTTSNDFVFNLPIPIENRTKEAPVVWYASNCNNAKNGRNDYVRKLMEYINVHSYGQCLQNKQTEEDMWLVVPRYKFYLAFENTCCEDYVTEKFWRTLALGVVPVVIGAPNIREFEPTPHSVIHADDFDSPKELADYLLYLDSHDDEYKKYLSYKTNRSEVSSGFHDLWKVQPCRTFVGNVCRFMAEVKWGHKVADRTKGVKADTSCRDVYYSY